MAEANPVTISRRGAVAIVTIDHAPVNALSRAVRLGLVAAMRELGADHNISAIIISGGPRRFIAGADLREMDLPPDEPFVPDVVAAIEGSAKPVIAAIDGPALGGGLEIALGCDLRLGSIRASVGLPETKLGIIPGAGGTQRLPRLVGVATAIALICEGRIVKAPEAKALGLLDAVAEGDVLEAAIAAAPAAVKRVVSALPVPAGDTAAEDAAAQAALKAAKGVPAIAEAIRVIRASRDGSYGEGQARERAAFLALRESEAARSLRHLFLAEREAAKIPGLDDVIPRAYARCGVIGAGTMGAGIAVSLADAGLYVTVVERDAEAAAAGLARIRGLYERQVASGRLSEAAMAERLARFTLTADWAALAHVDLVIEAAFEDMAVKQDIFRRLDAVAAPGAILATNTSYLDIEAMADVTSRPQDVIGLHFFAPANVMKLLEIVRPSRIAPEVLATGVALARKLGKQPVVAGVCDGFIGNRIYAVYRRHAEYLIAEGASPQQIDQALETFGFAMGVFAVSDMSGLDIAWAMRKRRAATRPPGERYVTIADTLCEAGRFGRKTGGGWYAYDSDGRRQVDPVVESVIETYRRDHQIRPRSFTTEEIQRRILAAMVNEGAKVLSEGIAYRASDIDLAFVNGYGFPRLKGGPMWAADRIGLDAILAEVEAAHTVGGVGSEPAALLVDLARAGKTFTIWRPQ